MENSFKYILGKPFDYSVRGEPAECHEIEFFAPSYKCFGYATKIEQSLTRALLQANKMNEQSNVNLDREREKVEKIKEDKKELKQMVKLAFLVSNENLEFILSDFMNMCEHVAEIDKNRPLERKYFSKIEYNDLKNMFFEYTTNFLMPSFFTEI